MAHLKYDLLNKIFGRLLVIERVYVKLKRRYSWACKCACGNIKLVSGSDLRRGFCTQCLSCGRRSAKRKKSECIRSQEPEYSAWKGMKQRCLNSSHRLYKYYGERGITVFEPWINSYPEFLKHIGPKTEKTLSIERINNNGNYEPGNVRWATKKEQAANRRKSQPREIK